MEGTKSAANIIMYKKTTVEKFSTVVQIGKNEIIKTLSKYSLDASPSKSSAGNLWGYGYSFGI